MEDTYEVNGTRKDRNAFGLQAPPNSTHTQSRGCLLRKSRDCIRERDRVRGMAKRVSVAITRMLGGDSAKGRGWILKDITIPTPVCCDTVIGVKWELSKQSSF